MQRGDFPANAQAQTQAIDFAVVRGVAPVKAVECALGQVFGHAGAGIFDGEIEVAAALFQCKPDAPCGNVVLRRVGIQVVDQLLGQYLVAAPQHARGDVFDDRYFVLKLGGIFGQAV